ncbi:hypothetical protein ABEF92_005713 [Exophiala dermatitidis]|uniref:Trafficking protein particle complex subunit 11 n=2 Tax=Exophiala dermatitidis TaxID=5970 RepID=H6BX93_EXODN|nr:uncharacterized protein HMPREF1120_04287 [Exophiala dermatitidis NIH/UT8656]EHY56195.1 hypothetical protein HMPREF1120_04287 [Exophiala dermatitidis NIH/UT8656]KAJ4503899.1 hypothetical protein HRR75_007922 [Exophiala dermatitidis]KAJ4538706.1 hypothetical protein HRR78_008043 [Exophiala dermatitidis]
MDRYPADYVLHNLPLLVLSGLGSGASESQSDISGRTHAFFQEGGFRIKVDVPPAQKPLAERLLQSFRAQDASEVPWHSQALVARNGRVFKIVPVGRVYTLPPRKAPPPPYSPSLSATVANGSPPPPLVLHSPLSPLTPRSPLYPDGIMSPLWITKHQSRLPCALLSFFSLCSDPHVSSLEDNKLKSEISNVRNVLLSTNYRTRVVLVLLGDGDITSSEVEDRCNNIRRATGLDGKSIYFLPHDATPNEVEEFVSSVLSYLNPLCAEYYRDLSKHARRKRNRNVVPQPTVRPGTSHPLSSQGWNVRYEFKLGVFAEFRQEMDAACRNYEAAYECLFGSEVIEAVPIWSPRFNEARLLADIIALRTIRCLLWSNQGTAAVRFWISHRDRTMDLVNRKGKGTDNYGWEAWQSAWAKVMAELLSNSEYPLLNVKNTESSGILSIFARPDKSLQPADLTTPWELIHHEGYWLDISRKCTSNRREWALQVPDEDRQSPGRSPASMVASRAHLYDTYLALEPYREVPTDGSAGYNYLEEILSTLKVAIAHFAKRGQLRKVEILELQKGLEQISAGSWTEAVATLLPLWNSTNWRRGGWWRLLQYLGWALLDCVSYVKDHALLIQLIWELSNSLFEPKPGVNYDLQLGSIFSSSEDINLSVVIDMDEAVSPLVPAFAFSTHNVFVGEPLECQLSIESRARQGLSPIQLTEARVVFEGSLKPICLVSGEVQHQENDASRARFCDVALEDSSSTAVLASKRSSTETVPSLIGVGDLIIAPGHTIIYRFRVIPREAGEISIASIALKIQDEKFTLTVSSSDSGHSTARWWEARNGIPIARPFGQESNAFNTIDVKPKPPKLQIEAPDLKPTYYTNESFNIDFDILNGEDEEVVVSVEVRMIGSVEGAAQIRWHSSETNEAVDPSSDTGSPTLPSRELGAIPSSGKTTVSLIVTGTAVAVDYEIEITARYALISEPETILTKTTTVDVTVIRPFEANYEFTPRLDADPWPNFFEAPPSDSDSASALGLRHRYVMAASICSFAAEPIVIEAILLTATKVVGGAVCSTSTGIVRKEDDTQADKDAAAISSIILPDQTQIFDFELTIQKLKLGDRHTVGLDLALEIGWRRQGTEIVNTTVLEVSKLLAPMAEPRVLLTTTDMAVDLSEMHTRQLKFTIENPSMHFLTFNISMEASEDFAFSGPKICAPSLVPISRHTITYQIFPYKRDQWVAVQLKVVDAYFGQTLKVLPGGEGVKVDKKGNLLVKV